MSISFPYEKKRIKEQEISDPRIILEIKTKFGFLKIKFLLDSGADVTTFPIFPYSELFDFKKSKKTKIGGIEGRGINAYPFSIKTRLEKEEFTLRCYFIESKIDPLLGRLDFWKLFSIYFDNKNLKTIIIPIRKI